MFELLYTSITTEPFSPDQSLDLLRAARMKNDLLHVTGLLLIQGQYVVQLLEGEEQVVKKLYNTIANDKRHQQVEIFHKNPIPKRSFSGWSMAFREIDNNNINFYLPDCHSLHRESLAPSSYYRDGSPEKHEFINAFKKICTIPCYQPANYPIY